MAEDGLKPQKMTKAQKELSLVTILTILELIPGFVQFLVPGIKRAIDLLKKLIDDLKMDGD